MAKVIYDEPEINMENEVGLLSYAVLKMTVDITGRKERFKRSFVRRDGNV